MTKTKIYAQFFENINKSTSINEYENYFHINAKFIDPFHEVEGIHNIYSIFQKMYKNLDNPRFEVIEAIEDKNVGYIKWKFIYSFKDENKENSFLGVSRVVFNSDDKAILHEDFWDAAQNIYEKIPFFKHLIKMIKNRIKA